MARRPAAARKSRPSPVSTTSSGRPRGRLRSRRSSTVSTTRGAGRSGGGCSCAFRWGRRAGARRAAAGGRRYVADANPEWTLREVWLLWMVAMGTRGRRDTDCRLSTGSPRRDGPARPRRTPVRRGHHRVPGADLADAVGHHRRPGQRAGHRARGERSGGPGAQRRLGLRSVRLPARRRVRHPAGRGAHGAAAAALGHGDVRQADQEVARHGAQAARPGGAGADARDPHPADGAPRAAGPHPAGPRGGDLPAPADRDRAARPGVDVRARRRAVGHAAARRRRGHLRGRRERESPAARPW